MNYAVFGALAIQTVKEQQEQINSFQNKNEKNKYLINWKIKISRIKKYIIMKNETILLALLSLMLISVKIKCLTAQTLSQYAILSSGKEFTSNSGVKSAWTMGDFMTEYSGSANNITQGFLQVELWIITALEPLNDIRVKIYPNPASSFLYIELPQNELFNIKFIDISGKDILDKENISGLYRIDLTELTTQTYFLTVKSKLTKNQSSFKLIHIK